MFFIGVDRVIGLMFCCMFWKIIMLFLFVLMK